MFLIELDVARRHLVADMFEGTCDTTIFSCLQGYMGDAWSDSITKPSFAILHVGDIIFLGGDETAITSEMLDEILPVTGHKTRIFMCHNPKFGAVLENHFGNRCTRVERYRVEKRNGDFDTELLKSYISKLPDGYHILPLKGEWCKIALSEEWSMDWLSNFDSIETFEAQSVGRIIVKTNESSCTNCKEQICAICKKKSESGCSAATLKADGASDQNTDEAIKICPKNSVIVSGASSYSIYDKGLEVQIDTHENYRRKGLAVIAGAALILACLERNLMPHWDAANMSSVHVAEKLGFTYEGPYMSYEITV